MNKLNFLLVYIPIFLVLTGCKKEVTSTIMKKKLPVWMGLFLSLLFVVGCEKKSVLEPTIWISYRPTVCYIGDTMTIVWRVQNASSAKLNEESIPFSGFQVVVITKDTTTFNFTLYPVEVSYGPTSKQMQIFAKEPPPPTDEELLCLNSWVENKARQSYVSEEGPWEDLDNIDFAAPCMIDNILTFYLTGKGVWDQGLLCSGEIVDPVNFDWSLDGNVLTNGGQSVIKHLDEEKMIWVGKSSSSSWNGTKWISIPIWIESTYVHPK